MLPLLTATALAAPPFESGPLEPVPTEPSAIAIADGELVLVGAAGVWIRSEGGWIETGLPGAAAILVEPAGSFLLCGPSGVTRYAMDDVVLSDVPCRDLAEAPEGTWVLEEERVRVLETGEELSIPARVAALGGGPERAWLDGKAMIVGGRERLVFPGATDVARIPPDDGSEAPRFVLVHPERSLMGLLGETGLESAWPQPLPASRVAVGDLGSDGTTEVVLAGPEGWTALTLRASRPPPPVPVPRPVDLPDPEPIQIYKPPQITSLAGVKMPNFGGLEPDPDYDQIFVGGFGVVLGDALGSSQIALSLSPAAVGGVERGRKRIRSYFGADSAPLFAWVAGENASGIHLALASAGFSIGSERLRAGPFATLGLLAAGAGVRAVFTPFESRLGKLTGFEGRITWFAPQAAHAGLYYVSAFPLGSRTHAAEVRDTRPSTCHRFGFGLGGAGGVSSTELSWDFVGRNDPYQFSWSPAVTISCENGGKSTGWTIGGESAPFFSYRVPTADGGADRRLHHAGSMTLGLYTGGDAVRLGPIVTGGVWTFGGGVRALLTPFETKQGAHHGLELRALALLPSAPSAQGMALYHVWFDPRVRPDPDEDRP